MTDPRQTTLATLVNTDGHRRNLHITWPSFVPPFYLLRNGRLFSLQGAWEQAIDHSFTATYSEVPNRFMDTTGLPWADQAPPQPSRHPGESQDPEVENESESEAA